MLAKWLISLKIWFPPCEIKVSTKQRHKTNKYTNKFDFTQRELLSIKQLTMPVTTDYEVFAERYHFPSEMEAREQKDEMIAKLQASEAKLQAELDLSRSFNERFREGHELCEVYKGQCEGMKAENEKLKAENEKLTELVSLVEHANFQLNVQLDTACEAFTEEQGNEFSDWSEDFDMTFHDLINQRPEWIRQS